MKESMRYLLACILLVCAACTQNENLLSSSDGPLRDEYLHALMAERIDELFQRITVLSYDQNLPLPELNRVRQNTANDIANAARELSGFADELLQLAGTLNLTRAEQQRFQNLAMNLLEASNDTARAATDLSPPDLASSINALQQTCADCHSLYRDQ